MQAVIQTGGKQYHVAKGQLIEVEKLDAEVGKNVDLEVLAILGDEPKFGQPLVDGAKVTAKVVDHIRGDKVIVSHYKRRKGYHLKQGHRQSLTCLEISDIKG